MQQGYTLITGLGTGTYDEQEKGRYKKTIYVFEDGKEYSCSVFCEALVEHYARDLKKIIIIGTVKSAWNALIADLDDNDASAELWLNIKYELESQGISDDNLLQLEEYLKNLYKGIDFKLLVHSVSFQKDTIASILSVYSQIYPNIEKNTKLVLDITHGFRYMPMLMYQTLQYHGNEFGIDNVKMLYGELGSDKKSFVRDVSDVWKIAEINKQVYAFKTSFDGLALGRTLKQYKEDIVSGWILGFSDLVQKNYVMQIKQAISELRNILKKKASVGSFDLDAFNFIDDIYNYLDDFANRFSTCDCLSDYLFQFAIVLNEKELTTQSIIALRESLWTKLLEKYSPEEIGTYVKDMYVRDFYKAFVDDCKDKGIYKDINDLIDERNQIAHAGIRGSSKKANPNQKTSEGSVFLARKIQYRKPDFDKYLKAVSYAFEKIL